MRPRNRRSRSCTYAVAIDGTVAEGELQAFAQYLSTLAPADCEVLVLDSASPELLESRSSVLRWVARHVPVPERYLSMTGRIDSVHAAADLSETEKVIVASPVTRCTAAEVRALCDLLERHDVVEPEEYVGAAPWWGGVEAGGMLLYRGVDQRPPGTTLAFRRSAHHPLRGFARGRDAAAVAFVGSDVHEAREIFVRREAAPLFDSLRGRDAGAFEFGPPTKSAFFFGMIPLLLALALVGGIDVAGGYAGVVTIASVVLAIRGRLGAGRYFPLLACLMAPLWIAERSLSVYWSLLARLGGATAAPAATAAARRDERAASGQ